MPRATVTLEFKGRRRDFTLPAGVVLIGRSADCDLVLPFPWVRERHLEVEQDAGWRRIRCAAADAQARMAGRPLNSEWSLLPDDATVELPTPFMETIRLRFSFESSAGGASVLQEQHKPQAGFDLPEFEVLESEPLPKGNRLFQPPVAAPTQMPALPAPERRAPSPAVRVLVVTLCATFLILAALGVNEWRRSHHAARIREGLVFITQGIQDARALISQGHYREAKQKLDAIRAVAVKDSDSSAYVREIDQICDRPEIRMGAIGYVLMEGQWLPPEKASAWKTASERDDPKIASLKTTAERAFESKDFPDLQACQEIAFAGNGVCSADPATVADAINARPQPAPVMRYEHLARWCLLAMLVFWPIDVWLRKLL
jgi:hypothetical protein